MATTRTTVDLIQSSIDNFTNGITSLQRDTFNKIYVVLKDLSLDADGNILPTIANMKLLNKIQRIIEGVVDNPEYQQKVADLEGTLNSIVKKQSAYFASTFTDFEPVKSLPIIQQQTFDGLVTQMTESGINENVVSHAVDIVSDGIQNGASLYDMTENLKTSLIGDETVDGKLLSYSKQTINDTLSGFTRTYNKLITDDLELVWYEYVGGVMDTTRPICLALVEKQWIHQSELAGIARGRVDGRQVSTAGMMPDTNGENFQSRCGGYNCEHQLVPVSEGAVPSKIRRKFEPEVSPDDNEIADERPRR